MYALSQLGLRSEHPYSSVFRARETRYCIHVRVKIAVLNGVVVNYVES